MKKSLLIMLIFGISLFTNSMVFAAPNHGDIEDCDGLDGDAYNLCEAYCFAKACATDDPNGNPKSCAALKRNFKKVTGSDVLPCDLSDEEKAELYYPTSLHNTLVGKKTFYSGKDGDPNIIGDGYETFTGVPYDDLSCKLCHDKGNPEGEYCDKCHSSDDYSDPVPNTTCKGCHGRQRAEEAKGITDVHNTAKPNCVDCHTWSEMHGDGTAYNSMWDPGAKEASCEGCHVSGADASAPIVAEGHGAHEGKLHCSACHVETVITCHNCHFDSEVDGTGKIAHAQFGGTGEDAFVLLANYSNQVRTASYQSLVYEGGNTYAVFGPFHGHSVMAEGRGCGDCHGNDAIQALNADGKIILTTWNEATGRVSLNANGVIPLAEGKIEMTFVDLVDPSSTPKTWSLINQGLPENVQYGYCTPLTDAQLQSMGLAD